MRQTLLFSLVLLLVLPLASQAATIVIVNSDGAGEGFNDPTAVSPVGGNTGTTIGQQRLNVFQAAADVWGALLPSPVSVRVTARFNPQSCDASSAVLGSAGPIEVFRDFSGAEIPGAWYHVALANRQAGVDLSGGSNDISTTFNSSIDNNESCLAGTNWYYGLDGNEGTDVELLPVVLHELGHGLGFSTLVGSSGAEFLGFPDVYETFMYDNTTGLHWDDMNNGQRAASAVNTGNVVWDGPASTFRSPNFLGGTPTLFVNSPPALPSTIAIGLANFGPELSSPGVTGNVVLVDDGTGTTSDGCEPLINGGAISGNIALIDRGTCAFTSKALAAQAAGATAVIIANNVAGATPIGLGGTDPSVVIPVVSVTLDDGNLIKAQLGVGVNVTLTLDLGNLAGADGSNRVQLYAPNPYEGGSSISHWDTAAFPNLLMEPAINDNLSSDVDLTLAHFTDIGWIAECVQADCPPNAPVARNTVVNLDFCVTNCGDVDDSISVTITDTEGWCAPVNQKVLVAAGDSVCVPVACSVPDTCDVVANVITFATQSSFGASDQCTTTLTSFCGPELELDPAEVLFTTVAFGDTVCDSVSVINVGDQPLNISSVTGCDTDGFALDLGALPATIAPGDTGRFEVCFSPEPGGANACVIDVVTDGGSGSVNVVVGGVTSVGNPGFGTKLMLAPVSPTPFANAAEVRFTLPREDHVRVEIFDFQGRRVRTLLAGEALAAGDQVLAWDGRSDRGTEVAGGIYFVRVATESFGSRVVRAVRMN